MNVPIGKGGNEPKRFNVIVVDLDQEIEFLEGVGIRKDEITAMCDCGETITQEDNLCSACNLPVVWQHSTVWRRMYGYPTTFLKGLREPQLAPKTALEIRVVEAFGTKGKFSNVSQADQFRALAKAHPEGYIMELITWAKSKRVGFHNFVKAVKNSDNVNKWKAKQADMEAEDDNEEDPDEGWGDWL